jgi:SMC interacting uncharacterized protein involved in chromosome segregation
MEERIKEMEKTMQEQESELASLKGVADELHKFINKTVICLWQKQTNFIKKYIWFKLKCRSFNYKSKQNGKL